MTHALELEIAKASTKTRILDVAERLFAQQGFVATSLRQITAEARANLAAVNYHFQSKEALIEAVLMRKIGPITERRLELLDAVESATEPVTLEAVFRSFFQPLFEAQQRGVDMASFPRLLTRFYTEDQGNPAQTLRTAFASTLARYRAAFEVVLPGMDARNFSLAMHFSIGALAHFIAAGKMLEVVSGEPHGSFDRDHVLESLIEYCSAGTRALWKGKEQV